MSSIFAVLVLCYVMLFIVNLLIKTDSTVVCVLVCLSMFVMSHFL